MKRSLFYAPLCAGACGFAFVMMKAVAPTAWQKLSMHWLSHNEPERRQPRFELMLQ